MKHQPKKTSGFSLLEVLVSMAILLILLGIAVPYGFDSYQRQTGALVASNLTHLLQSARARAVTQSFGGPWGVHIDQLNRTMTLFHGSDYGDDPAYDEVISYPDSFLISSSSPTDITFDARVGTTNSLGSIVFQISSPFRTKQVTVSQEGVVLY